MINDGAPEGLERILIKLTAPNGGATLRSPSIASVYISDPGDTPVVEFSSASISIAESGFGTAIAIVKRAGSASGAVSVDYMVSNGDATPGMDYIGPATGTLAWADGDANPKWIEYSIVDDGSPEANEFIELTLGNISGGSIGPIGQFRINILDGTGTNDPPDNGNVTPVVRGGGGSPSLWLLLALLISSASGARRLAATRTGAS